MRKSITNTKCLIGFQVISIVKNQSILIIEKIIWINISLIKKKSCDEYERKKKNLIKTDDFSLEQKTFSSSLKIITCNNDLDYLNKTEL